MTAEQKAEEIANKRCHEIMCFGHCNFSSPKHHRCGEWHREYNCALDGYHEGFKDCAKSRLNVTTISDCPIKDEWHYPSKGELPKDEKEVLVYMWGSFYIGSYKQYTDDNNAWHFNDFDEESEQITAWKEIVPPKEIE